MYPIVKSHFLYYIVLTNTISIFKTHLHPMTTTTQTDAPKSLKIIAILAILWNLMGVLAYLGHAYTDPESLPESQQAYIDYPAWVTAAFATSVFAGLFGSITLLLRKKISNLLFILSFVCVIAQKIYDSTQPDIAHLYTMSAMILTGLVFIVCIYLIMYSKKGIDKGWLN